MGSPVSGLPEDPVSGSRMRVLVVEDDAKLRRPLTLTLASRGYDVVGVETGREALASIAAHTPDLVVLDLGLPDMDGFDVLDQLRTGFAMPVLVLSARDSAAEKVRLLDGGANDYITKPFGMDELLARVRVALRQGSPTGAPQPEVVTEVFTVDLAAKRVRDAAGTPIALTPTEWGLLELLASRPGQLVTQRELLQHVWGPGFEKQTHYLRIYMGHLRRKLEPDPTHPRYLLTEVGRGYTLDPTGHRDPART